MGDIDPHNLDVEHQPKRRKRRDRPDPPPALKANEPDAVARLGKLPLSPGIMLEPAGERWAITAPHNDLNLWEVQRAGAVGSRSQSFIRIFLGHLKALCGSDWDEGLQRWKCKETEWNAALAMVAEQQPSTSSQAALAAQMVAVHWMTMRLAAQALNNGGMVMERDAAIASKLARTFTMQLEQMQLLKGKRKTTRQSIKVHKTLRQEVHYHDHRGTDKTDEQSHGPDEGAHAIEGRHALPSKGKGDRPALRLACGARQGSV